jgi:hypothetical protein
MVGGTTLIASTDVVLRRRWAGKRLVTVARHQPGSPTQDLAEMQAVVDSMTGTLETRLRRGIRWGDASPEEREFAARLGISV